MPTPRSNGDHRASNSLQILEASLGIDENNLQRECVGQPDLFYRVAKQVALARSVRDQRKRELANIESQVTIDLKRDAERSEQRVTVAELEANRCLHPQVQRAGTALAQANDELGNLEALKEALSQRKDMLKELVSLYLGQYYSDPGRSAEARFNRGDRATEQLRRARIERDRNRRG